MLHKTQERWLCERLAAAELGRGYAQMMLGRYLAAGAPGKRNPREAELWLERAVARGVTEAQSDLSQLVTARGEFALEASGPIGQDN